MNIQWCELTVSQGQKLVKNEVFVVLFFQHQSKCDKPSRISSVPNLTQGNVTPHI